MTYAKNSLGRSTGRRFNMAAIKRELSSTPQIVSFDHRGFEISGGISGRWFVANWQTIYTSRKAAIEAVDACLKLRAVIAGE